MKISLFDKLCSQEDYENGDDYFESDLVISGMLLADSFTLISDDPRINCMFIETSQLSDEDVIHWFKQVFKYGENARNVIEYYESNVQFIKKLIHTRKKDKATMAQYINLKKEISNLKRNINNYRNTIIDEIYLKGVLPFYQDGSLLSCPLEDISDSGKEDVFIKPLVNALIDPEEMISFAEFIEEYYYHEIGDAKVDDCRFIRIPLCSLPLLKDITYAQIKFTRDDLTPALLSLKKCVRELSVEFIKIPFTVENLTQIKELCIEKLIPQIEPLQKKIDESLYLCQQRNIKPVNTGLKLALGLSSVDFILESLEYIDVILPYVRSEITRQISRYITPESGKVFLYIQENNPEE